MGHLYRYFKEPEDISSSMQTSAQFLWTAKHHPGFRNWLPYEGQGDVEHLNLSQP